MVYIWYHLDYTVYILYIYIERFDRKLRKPKRNDTQQQMMIGHPLNPDPGVIIGTWAQGGGQLRSPRGRGPFTRAWHANEKKPLKMTPWLNSSPIGSPVVIAHVS